MIDNPDVDKTTDMKAILSDQQNIPVVYEVEKLKSAQQKSVGKTIDFMETYQDQRLEGGKDSLSLAEILSLGLSQLSQMSSDEQEKLHNNLKPLKAEEMQTLMKEMEKVINILAGDDYSGTPEKRVARGLFGFPGNLLFDSSEVHLNGKSMATGIFSIKIEGTGKKFKVHEIKMGPENKRIKTLVVEEVETE